MDFQQEELAVYIYPLPKGTSYTARDLMNPREVEGVFGYCSILEGLISKRGWEFLIDTYGYERLYEINKESDWADCSTVEEYKNWVSVEMANSPETL